MNTKMTMYHLSKHFYWRQKLTNHFNLVRAIIVNHNLVNKIMYWFEHYSFHVVTKRRKKPQKCRYNLVHTLLRLTFNCLDGHIKVKSLLFM